ncbi:phosphatidylserine decarboxylase family protein [Pelovirga terrestris]|uniref:Phosphatidylserine decarboxylase proenzyme n=1 Tax=Pelovirga terrestris TaxID=2771352 RepID=A0A8J6QLY5_9BACT|nr:phosphatidylserine decarboxylase family protein [Pelovirga terrestris]MBD1400954.1 phosphatidylserine decarboxylase family protein [Pelovirga terrestris]
MYKADQFIAREGYPFIVLFGFVTLVFALLGWTFVTLILLFLTLFTAYFFRDPVRVVPVEEGVLVAPADGKVIFVGEVDEERFFNARVTKVSIFMSVFDVHINRAPCAGKVVDMFYNKGEFVNASYDKASESNEQSGILLETGAGPNILFVQIAGLIARRIITYPVIGDILERGARYGLIRFGSRVDLYLPSRIDVSITLGERTVAGETIVGRFN